MTFETINQQNILETAALRFKMIVAESGQEVRLKVSPSAEAEGFIILAASSSNDILIRRPIREPLSVILSVNGDLIEELLSRPQRFQ